MATPSLADVANGIRNLFAQVVGADVANNPHILTRTYAKGISIRLYLLGLGSSGAAAVSGASVSLAVQVVNPDGSLTTVSQMVAGPSDASGLLSFSDTQSTFDLTRQHQLVAQATFPDGTSQAGTLPLWSYPPGGNWGAGFSVNWLTAYPVGGSSTATQQGVSITVYPTSGDYPLSVQAVASPAIGSTGLTYVWYESAPNAGTVLQTSSSSQYFRSTLPYSITLYCVMTDSSGVTYKSASVVVTVTNSPPKAGA